MDSPLAIIKNLPATQEQLAQDWKEAHERLTVLAYQARFEEFSAHFLNRSGGTLGFPHAMLLTTLPPKVEEWVPQNIAIHYLYAPFLEREGGGRILELLHLYYFGTQADYRRMGLDPFKPLLSRANDSQALGLQSSQTPAELFLDPVGSDRRIDFRIINLEQSADRREFQAQTWEPLQKEVSLSFFRATDGTKGNIWAKVKACLSSHLRCVHAGHQSLLRCLLVLEDDAIPNQPLAKFLPKLKGVMEVAGRTMGEWEHLQLGTYQFRMVSCPRQFSVEDPVTGEPLDISLFSTDFSLSTFAQIYHCPTAMVQLQAWGFPHAYQGLASDLFCTRHLRTVVADPLLFEVSNSIESIIRGFSGVPQEILDHGSRRAPLQKDLLAQATHLRDHPIPKGAVGNLHASLQRLLDEVLLPNRGVRRVLFFNLLDHQDLSKPETREEAMLVFYFIYLLRLRGAREETFQPVISHKIQDLKGFLVHIPEDAILVTHEKALGPLQALNKFPHKPWFVLKGGPPGDLPGISQTEVCPKNQRPVPVANLVLPTLPSDQWNPSFLLSLHLSGRKMFGMVRYGNLSTNLVQVIFERLKKDSPQLGSLQDLRIYKWLYSDLNLYYAEIHNHYMAEITSSEVFCASLETLPQLLDKMQQYPFCMPLVLIKNQEEEALFRQKIQQFNLQGMGLSLLRLDLLPESLDQIWDRLVFQILLEK